MRAHEATPNEERSHPHALQRRGRVQEAHGTAGDPQAHLAKRGVADRADRLGG